jgi:hypothetical protein
MREAHDPANGKTWEQGRQRLLGLHWIPEVPQHASDLTDYTKTLTAGRLHTHERRRTGADGGQSEQSMH